MIAIGEEWFGNPDAIIEPVNGNKYRWATNGVIFPIQNIQYGHPVFQKLITNPKIIRVIASFTFNSPRLAASIYTFYRINKNHKVHFHRDGNGFIFPQGMRNPHMDYQKSMGTQYANHSCASITLTDIPEGTGFAVIPGSHRSKIQFPEIGDDDLENNFFYVLDKNKKQKMNLDNS